VIFEEGTKGLGEAILYCRNLKRRHDWAREVFGHIGTDSKANLISLQAADFLAYHMYQRYEAERSGIAYEIPESFRLSTQHCRINHGRLPREEMPAMIRHVETLEMFNDAWNANRARR